MPPWCGPSEPPMKGPRCLPQGKRCSLHRVVVVWQGGCGASPGQAESAREQAREGASPSHPGALIMARVGKMSAWVLPPEKRVNCVSCGSFHRSPGFVHQQSTQVVLRHNGEQKGKWQKCSLCICNYTVNSVLCLDTWALFY